MKFYNLKKRGRSFLQVLTLLLIIFQGNLKSQEQYEFNRPGSTNYFTFVCYASDGVISYKRPIIFLLGNPGETAMDIYEKDKLKEVPDFHNYMFVYVPNSAPAKKLSLRGIEALSSLVTLNYSYGKTNLFLQINDTAITQQDVKSTNLYHIFENIRFSEPMLKNTLIAQMESQQDSTVLLQPEEVRMLASVEEVFAKNEIPEEYLNKLPIEEKPKVKYEKFYGPPENFNFTLSGLIKDAQTGEALPFATILVNGTTNGTTTNMDGYFTLNNVPTDTTTLTIMYIGYDNAKVPLSPRMPKTNLVLRVEPSAITLETVEIVARREELMKVSNSNLSTITMTPKSLDQLPSMGGKDVMRSFQLMPGISASNESSSGMYVRGGTPDQNLIVYDGFTIYHVDHLYGFFSAFNSDAIKDVQLHKGGFESRFGGRLSSVTEITGKDGNQNNFNIGGDVSLLSMNAYAEMPLGDKFTSIVAFRKSYQGFIYNTIFDQYNDDNTEDAQIGGRTGPGFDGQDTEVSSYFYDLNGKFTYRPNDKDIISLSIFNGTDHLDNGYEMSTPSRLEDAGMDFGMEVIDLTNYGNFGTALKWSRKWNPKLYGNTVVSYSNYYSDRENYRDGDMIGPSGDSTAMNSGMEETNDLKDFSFKSDYQWDVHKNIQIEAGAFGTYYDIQYEYIQNDTTTILDRQDYGVLAGGYLQTQFKLFDNKLNILPGLRTSFYDRTEKVYFEPRFSLSYELSDALKLKGSYGKFYQFANRVTREDITSGSRDFWILSDNDAIDVSEAQHFIAGLSYETKDFLLSVEGYYKDLKGLTEYSLRYDASFQGVDYTENFYTGDGYAQGIELLAQKKSGKINGWMSYTLGEARNQFDVYGDDYFPASQDVTHEFKIVGLYNHKRWDFSATWIFATGRPYTAPSGAYTITLLDGTELDYFTTTTKNGLRLPDYHRLDVAAKYKLFSANTEVFYGREQKDRRQIGYIGFSLFNVYDRENTWYNQYEIIEGEIIETRVNYLGIMPNITLSLKLR